MGSAAIASEKDGVHHYIFFNMDRERIKERAFLDCGSIDGAQLKYMWKELEPGENKYDFSSIETDLQFLHRNHKKLFVQLQDVTFTPGKVCVPDYLLKDGIYSGGVAVQYNGKAVDGTVARRWDNAVQERFILLLAELGKRFDGRIDGINLPETAVDVIQDNKVAPKGFTPLAYRNAILKNIAALKKSFPKTVCVQYANYMPGEWLPDDDHSFLRSVFQYAANSGVGIGGPDLFPYKKPQMNHSYRFMSEWRKFNPKASAPVTIAVQDGNQSFINPHTKKKVTPSDLLEFARNYLNAEYIFWCTEEPYYSRGLLPLFQSLTPKREPI